MGPVDKTDPLLEAIILVWLVEGTVAEVYALVIAGTVLFWAPLGLYLDETTLRELKSRELSVAQRAGFLYQPIVSGCATLLRASAPVRKAAEKILLRRTIARLDILPRVNDGRRFSLCFA